MQFPVKLRQSSVRLRGYMSPWTCYGIIVLAVNALLFAGALPAVCPISGPSVEQPQLIPGTSQNTPLLSSRTCLRLVINLQRTGMICPRTHLFHSVRCNIPRPNALWEKKTVHSGYGQQ